MAKLDSETLKKARELKPDLSDEEIQEQYDKILTYAKNCSTTLFDLLAEAGEVGFPSHVFIWATMLLATRKSETTALLVGYLKLFNEQAATNFAKQMPKGDQ